MWETGMSQLKDDMKEALEFETFKLTHENCK
jgi:hypothetical protein